MYVYIYIYILLIYIYIYTYIARYTEKIYQQNVSEYDDF